MSSQESKLEASDAELVERAQSGDSDAFAELWRRHYRSAARVARQVTSSIDADDLVSEAYARIYQRVLAGGGPTSGAFRPYLYTTIRNLAATWGAASRDVNVDQIEEKPDERIPDDPAAWALDRTLTARAFRSLPERWQTVLWYTEVEGLDPHEVAPILGMTANGVAALSYRAREGLRTAWLQAHVSDSSSSGECRWAIERLGNHARNSLGERDRARLEAHLLVCAKCTIISEEVDEVGSRLALILIPALIGGVAGGALLTQLAAPSAAMAAEAVPAMPSALAALGGSHAVGAGAAGSTIGAGAVGAAVAGGAATTGAAVGIPSLVGSLAIAAVVGGSLLLGAPAPATTPTPTTAAAAPAATSTPLGTPLPAPAQDPADAAPDTATTDGSDSATSDDSLVGGVVGDATGTVGGVVNGATGTVGGVVKGATGTVGGVVNGATGTVGGVVDGATGVVGQVTGPVALPFSLTGQGTPGATVVARAGSAVLGSTVVGRDGAWSLAGSAPADSGQLRLTQDARGLLGGLLGSVLTPLTVSGDSGGLPIVTELLR